MKNVVMHVLCWGYLIACPGVLIWTAYTLKHEAAAPSRLAVATLNHISPAE